MDKIENDQKYLPKRVPNKPNNVDIKTRLPVKQ